MFWALGFQRSPELAAHWALGLPTSGLPCHAPPTFAHQLAHPSTHPLIPHSFPHPPTHPRTRAPLPSHPIPPAVSATDLQQNVRPGDTIDVICAHDESTMMFEVEVHDEKQNRLGKSEQYTIQATESW